MSPKKQGWYLDPTYCNELLNDCRETLSQNYKIDQILNDQRPLVIGKYPEYNNGNFVERTTERTDYIDAYDKEYVLNREDYDSFELEMEDVLGFDYDKDIKKIAHVTFIGLGVGRTAIRHMFGNNVPVDHKKEQYAQMLGDFFSSHDDIEEMLVGVFDLPDFEERASMANVLTDKRAESINGLRMCMRVLFDTSYVLEETGMEYYDLIDGAKQYIKRSYFNAENQTVNDLMTECGSKPLKIDEHFFDRLPDWIIAAATPMRPNQLKALFAKSWQID